MNTTNRPSKAFRLSHRILGTAAFLFAVSPTEPCSAAEVTFGPRDNYSVQLPDTWTAKVDKDKKLGANGPDRLTLNAFIGSTETPPEALMEKIITSSSEKKAGYKLIEKGSVKTNAGGKASLHRYQLAAKSGTEVWVDYYFQLAEKEVVILVFAFPSNISKSPKGEIEAIFNSVKVSTAAAQDDSWLTTPADKSKESSKASGAGDSKIEGIYVQTERPADYFELKADGTFSIHQSAGSATGTYTHNGATITFKFSSGETDTGKHENETLVDQFGGRWVKKSPAPAAPKTAGKPVTFATNCTVELPAGWTAKAVDNHLEGKGPGGAIIDGISARSANAVDKSMAEHLSVFEKMPAYELVDTDEISTKAGAKGMLSYYRYNRTSGPTAEVGVIINVAPNQLVTLRFLAPSTTKKLPDTFMQGTEAIFSSLKISK